MASIIKTPNIYITPDLVEGEPCAIHLLNKKQPFLTLKFEEGNFEIPFKPILSVDNSVDLIKTKLNKQISRIEDEIVGLGEVYTCYNYLLTVRDNEIYLLSLSLGGMSLGFEITCEVAETIKVKTYKAIFKGPYTNFLPSAFIEDIFIQKQ